MVERAARAGVLRHVMLFGAPVALVAIVGIYVLATSDGSSDGGRTTVVSVPAYAPTVERFVAAWNASDYDAIGALCSTKNARRIAAWLRRMPAKKGWGDGLPRLGEASPQTLDRDPTQVVHDFPVPDLGSARLVVRFEWENERWTLKKVRPPKSMPARPLGSG